MLLSYNADILPKVRMLGHIRYRDPWIHFSRTIDEFILYAVRDGNMYLREDGIPFHLQAGDFFLLEPGLPHEGYQKAACDYYYVHFTHADMFRVQDEEQAMLSLAEKRRKSLLSYNLDKEDPTDSITYLPKQFHMSGEDFKMSLHAAAEIYNGREEHYKRRTSAQIHSFLLQIAHEHLLAVKVVPGRNIRRSEVVAEQLLAYLNQHYAEHLTSQGIAERFEMNFDYINRVFSRMTGTSIFSYLNMLRINNAKQLIATTDLRFSEIAYLVGIENRYYFSSLFRKLTGSSPTEYYKDVRSR